RPFFFLTTLQLSRSSLLPYTTLFRSFFLELGGADHDFVVAHFVVIKRMQRMTQFKHYVIRNIHDVADAGHAGGFEAVLQPLGRRDRKSTRLNSSHLGISYAVFCLKKK